MKLLALFFLPTSIYPLPRGLDINHLSSVLIAVASGSPYTYPTTLGMTDPVMFIVLSRCQLMLARLPYILIMLFVYKCYTLCESFFSIDTLLLQTYDVCCCITMSYRGKNN